MSDNSDSENDSTDEDDYDDEAEMSEDSISVDGDAPAVNSKPAAKKSKLTNNRNQTTSRRSLNNAKTRSNNQNEPAAITASSSQFSVYNQQSQVAAAGQISPSVGLMRPLSPIQSSQPGPYSSNHIQQTAAASFPSQLASFHYPHQNSHHHSHSANPSTTYMFDQQSFPYGGQSGNVAYLNPTSFYQPAGYVGNGSSQPVSVSSSLPYQTAPFSLTAGAGFSNVVSSMSDYSHFVNYG
jgi:hypothetical protein